MGIITWQSRRHDNQVDIPDKLTSQSSWHHNHNKGDIKNTMTTSKQFCLISWTLTINLRSNI